MRKGDKRRLNTLVTLLENPHGDSTVRVELSDPTSWTRKQQLLTSLGDLTGRGERMISGCRECICDQLKRIIEQKVIKSETLVVQVYSRDTCPSAHGDIASDEPDDGTSSQYEEDD